MSEAGLVRLRCNRLPIKCNICATIHYCARNNVGDGLGLLCDDQTPTLDRGPNDLQQVVDRQRIPASLLQRGVNSQGHACAQPAVRGLDPCELPREQLVDFPAFGGRKAWTSTFATLQPILGL